MNLLERPVAWILEGAEEQGIPLDDVYEAIKEAGRELVSNGSMKEETLATIAREFMPRDVAVQLMTEFFGDK